MWFMKHWRLYLADLDAKGTWNWNIGSLELECTSSTAQHMLSREARMSLMVQYSIILASKPRDVRWKKVENGAHVKKIHVWCTPGATFWRLGSMSRVRQLIITRNNGEIQIATHFDTATCKIQWCLFEIGTRKWYPNSVSFQKNFLWIQTTEHRSHLLPMITRFTAWFVIRLAPRTIACFEIFCFAHAVLTPK